jgi:hypothetical protein
VPPPEPDEFIRDIRDRQRNIVFPDTVRNARPLYVFCWRGSPNPTWPQRVGAWLFGLIFAADGLFLFTIARENNSDATALMGYFQILLGAWIFRNGFPRGPR